MRSFKLFLLTVIAVVAQQSAAAQSYKLITKNFSVMEKTPRGTWGKWSDLQEAKLIGTIDTNKGRIVIYSQEVQLYTITTYGKREETETDIIYPFVCQDIDGVKFTISLITRKKQNYRKQLYINHPNVIVVYNLESVTDE